MLRFFPLRRMEPDRVKRVDSLIPEGRAAQLFPPKHALALSFRFHRLDPGSHPGPGAVYPAA